MSKEYWNRRYSLGGTSGKGSIGKERKWKWDIIKRTLQHYDEEIKNCSFLDLGCGDLSFWDHKRPKYGYTGIDYSKEIIDANRGKWVNWDKWPKGHLRFHAWEITEETARKLDFHDITLCFDVLFHQPLEETFLQVLQGLNTVNSFLLFATNYDVVIRDAVAHYMSYRDLTQYLSVLDSWRLIGLHRWKPDGKMLYVFEKRL